MKLSNPTDLIDRHGLIAAQVQPSVEEHRAVPGRKNEPVAIEPFRVIRAMPQGVTVQNRANLRAAKRQSEVAALTGVNRVDGKAPSDGSGLRENLLGKQGHCA